MDIVSDKDYLEYLLILAALEVAMDLGTLTEKDLEDYLYRGKPFTLRFDAV